MTNIKLGDVEIDVDSPLSRRDSDPYLLWRILAQQKHEHQLNENRWRQIMIDNALIQQKLDGLNAAAANIIAHLPPSTTASTPDSVVAGILGTIDSVTQQLNAAAGPATPTPAPAPAA